MRGTMPVPFSLSFSLLSLSLVLSLSVARETFILAWLCRRIAFSLAYSQIRRLGIPFDPVSEIPFVSPKRTALAR